MFAFKKTNTQKYTKTGPSITPDFLYWKRLGVPVLVKEFGGIDYIDFSAVEPYNFAVTCSVRVQIYNPITKLVATNLSKFQKTAFGGTFRRDGKLLVAGDEEGFVKLFDVSSKNVLRFFRGHTAPVHRTCFTSDMVHVGSFCDDKTVKLWDVPTEKAIHTFTGHTDYIRAGASSPNSSNIILSGGYDKIVKMWDTRTQESILDVNHGSPVESLLFLPTGGIFITAGGTEIKVWDAFNSGRLISRISQHHKTVTCLRLASNGRRLLSGSLDRHVKVYDIANYQTVHSLNFPNAILSVGISPNDDTLVAGMVDGHISIQRMEEEEKPLKRAKKITPSNLMVSVDQIVPEFERQNEAKYDQFLRKYEYSKALDCVLRTYIVNKCPHVTVSVIQELIKRRGLQQALAGRSHKSLATFIRFIIRYTGEYRFVRVLIDATNILLDVYESSIEEFTGEMVKLFAGLAKKLQREQRLTYQFMKLQGALELVLAGATVNTPLADEGFAKGFDDMQQSKVAKKHSIITVT